MHETDSKLLPVVPAGFGLGTIPHVDPSQCSTSVEVGGAGWEVKPTAVQLLTAGHDTEVNSLRFEWRGLGLGTMVQAPPDHCSMSVVSGKLPTPKPTAMQLVADKQDTARSSLSDSEVLGLGAMIHEAPFRCSISVSMVPLLSKFPMAVQLVAVAHETPDRLIEVPGGFGLGTTVHTTAAETGGAPTPLRRATADRAMAKVRTIARFLIFMTCL
jgi:hypothetical protein